jgi:hypothetical protein
MLGVEHMPMTLRCRYLPDDVHCDERMKQFQGV